jgi:pimeloyl-ACP methyl ester carboxylesterase
MASDVLAVMDVLHLEKASLVGWSDGACTALILSTKVPARVARVFFFACNMDPSGVKPFEATPTLNRCFARHAKDYVRLSATPGNFKDFVDAVTLMQQTQPNYSERDLAEISVPVTIVHSEHDEFIKREHAQYLARSIPNAELVVLNGVSHFAPLQRPEQFNSAMLAFLHAIRGISPLTKDHGIRVLHTGQPLPATATDEALQQVRKERDMANFGEDE